MTKIKEAEGPSGGIFLNRSMEKTRRLEQQITADMRRADRARHPVNPELGLSRRGRPIVENGKVLTFGDYKDRVRRCVRQLELLVLRKDEVTSDAEASDHVEEDRPGPRAA